VASSPSGDSDFSGVFFFMADEVLPKRSPLERFPQHVHALGMAVVELAALEITCVHLLAAILRTTEAVADAILMSSLATRARIDIIKSVALATLDDNNSKTIIELMTLCERLLNKRNKYVHGVWGAKDGKVKLVPLPKGDTKDIPIGELVTFVNQLRNAADTVESLTRSLLCRPHYTINILYNITE
jgi:hypothetical protein